jgi:hypothetical protein
MKELREKRSHLWALENVSKHCVQWQDSKKAKRATDSHTGVCSAGRKINVRSCHPLTADSIEDSNIKSKLPYKHSSQGFSHPPRPALSRITGPKSSNAGTIQPSPDIRLDYALTRKNYKHRQCSGSPNAMQAIYDPDESRNSPCDVHPEVNISGQALNVQVKPAWNIRAKHERLTEHMNDLESRRRDAHLRLEAAIAEMEADINEHLRLSLALEKL